MNASARPHGESAFPWASATKTPSKWRKHGSTEKKPLALGPNASLEFFHGAVLPARPWRGWGNVPVNSSMKMEVRWCGASGVAFSARYFAAVPRSGEARVRRLVGSGGSCFSRGGEKADGAEEEEGSPLPYL